MKRIKITVLCIFLCSLMTTGSKIHAAAPATLASGIGIVSSLVYYYLMLKKEHANNTQQESYINQLILNQEISPSLRESIRALIKRCTVESEKYKKQKTMTLLPLALCSLSLGYALGKGD